MRLTFQFLICFLLIAGASVEAGAKSFSGYKKNRAAGELELSGHVDQLLETETEFKVLISNNAAFYLFPKLANQNEIKTLLNQSQAQKKKLNFQINAYSREIVSLESVSEK